MTKGISAFGLALFALILSGCATTPTALSDASPVPRQRLYGFQTLSQQATATLVVTRDKGFSGSACYTAFYINGELAARYGNRETATFHVKPGEVLLRYGLDPKGNGLCALGASHWAEQETIMRPSETKHFRLTLGADGAPIVQRSD